MTPPGDSDPDYRFSLANERTFLAWIRTAIALIAGGVAAAKALDFHHDVSRWIVAVPPIVAGGWLAIEATLRWRLFEESMRSGARLPVGRGLKAVGLGLGVYALLVLVTTVADG